METSIDLCRSALVTALILSTPILLVGMVVGLAVGLIQALTQVQDQTVSFVPKVMGMAGAMIICLPWLVGRMIEFTSLVFEQAAQP